LAQNGSKYKFCPQSNRLCGQTLIIKYAEWPLGFLPDGYEIDVFQISEESIYNIKSKFEEIREIYPVKSGYFEEDNYDIIPWGNTPINDELKDLIYTKCFPSTSSNESLKKQRNANIAVTYFNKYINKENCFYCGFYKLSWWSTLEKPSAENIYFYIFDPEDRILITIVWIS
jgi:hypothetical protein